MKKLLLLLLTISVISVTAQTTTYLTAHKSLVFEKNNSQTDWKKVAFNSSVFIPISITNDILTVSAKNSITIKIDIESERKISGKTTDNELYTGKIFDAWDFVNKMPVTLSIVRYNNSDEKVLILIFTDNDTMFMVVYYIN